MAKSQVGAKQPGTRRPNSKLTEIPSAHSNTPPIFKVPFDFRSEFKTYAAQHNKKLNQLLIEAFAALKAKND